MKVFKRWLGKPWLFLLALLGIFAIVAAIIAGLMNLQALEKQRIQEYQSLADKMVEMATNFVMQQQYDNLLALMQLQTKTSMIEFMAVYINRAAVIQSGNAQCLEKGPAVPMPLALKVRQTFQTERYWFMDQVLPYPKEPVSQQSIIRIVFSLEEFYARKRALLVWMGILSGFILILAGLSYLLWKTQQKLKQEEKTKDAMVQAIAHDALHYVSVIKVIHDSQRRLRKEKPLIEDMKKDLDEIFVSNDSLEKLLENLKYSEYLKKGVVINRPEKIPWQEFLQKRITRYKEMLDKKGLHAELIPNPASYCVWADKELAECVVNNLIHNAFKFTRPGGSITLGFHADEKMLKTFVQDQGAGIPKNEWENIFKPNVRLRNDMYVRPEDRRGTGLGLSNARQFVRLYGGELGIETSEINVGSRFYFTLPLAKEISTSS